MRDVSLAVGRMTRAAVIAALYVVLCLLLQPVSYGPVQIRISEALAVLVVLCPEAVVGVTLGCFLSNLLSFSPVDLVVGTLATLVAALISYRLRGHRVGRRQGRPGLALAASLPPVLVNAVVIGAELSLLYTPKAGLPGFVANMLSVGAGQVVSCCVLGVGLVWVIEKNPALHKLFTNGRRVRPKL